jgi:hypothetical protein
MAVRVFKDVGFRNWARAAGVTDAMLCGAASEIESGLVGARLGGFLLKKRVAAPGRGKSGGYRVIVAHRQGDRLVFIYGFSKGEKENITSTERKALLKLGDQYMRYSAAVLSDLAAKRLIVEVRCHEQNP